MCSVHVRLGLGTQEGLIQVILSALLDKKLTSIQLHSILEHMCAKYQQSYHCCKQEVFMMLF